MQVKNDHAGVYEHICEVILHYITLHSVFPGGLDGEESACNAGDPGSIPGSGRPLEEGRATHSSILVWRIPMDRGAWRATVHGVALSQT